MSDESVLEAIRVRAHSLWEQAGRPEGGDLTFREEARQQIEREREQEASLSSEG